MEGREMGWRERQEDQIKKKKNTNQQKAVLTFPLN